MTCSSCAVGRETLKVCAPPFLNDQLYCKVLEYVIQL